MIHYSDSRPNDNGGSGKHTANMRPTGTNGGCDLVHLRTVAHTPDSYGPCLTRWYAAANGNDRTYGSQMGSDTADPATYERLIREAVENGTITSRGDRMYHDVREPVGVTVGDREITTVVQVRDVRTNAHLVPIPAAEREV